MSTTTTKKRDVYQVITDRIIEKLEAGTVPWHRPWSGESGQFPANLVSKKEYRGINVFLLAAAGFSSPYFVTFRQCQQLGGRVKRGEKGTPVVFWKFFDTKKTEETESGEEKTTTRRIPMIRYYTVFNIEQTEGIDPKKIPETEHESASEFLPLEHCQAIIDAMPKCPEIRHGEARAYYSPGHDFVNMPKAEKFNSSEEYYSTLFHELTHATGHQTRLNRDSVVKRAAFGDKIYSREELVAEMGAAFMCGICQIENKIIDNSAAYISGWLSILHGDNKLVIIAAQQAQKAADFMLDRKPDYQEQK